MKTLILDNYDSFTFNLYQYVAELEGNPVVYRNDEIAVEDVPSDVTHIILSPGPGNPESDRDIGISRALIDYAAENTIPFLGVCLGHQTLGYHYGADVIRAPEIFHGKASNVSIVEPRSVLFTDMPDSLEVMRYHSLCIKPGTLPENFRVTAVCNLDIIMAIEHASLPLYGIQFHPESIGTPHGKNILRHFLALA